jgi:hypothetical protein
MGARRRSGGGIRMINEVHQALRQLIYKRGRIEPAEVDIRFDAPSEEWMNSLIQPTISVFLYDIQENIEKRETNMQTLRSNGKGERRMPPRRIDLYHMISALCADPEDEHQLLWRVLGTLMKYSQWPVEILPDAVKSVEPPITSRMANAEDSRPSLDIWNALGTRPRAALSYIVTAPLDLEVTIEAPLVLTRTARYRNAFMPGVVDPVRTQIGGVVRNKAGRPVENVIVKLESTAENSKTDTAGQYVLRNVPSGPVRLSVLREGSIRKRVAVNVPAESYDIVMDE